MKKYFYHRDGQQFGPYSKEELVHFKITRDTMVWCEGQPEWTSAQNIEDLSDLFRNQPPPFEQKTTSTPPPFENTKRYSDQSGQQGKSNYKWVFWLALALIVLGSVSYFIYGNYRMKQDAMQLQIDAQKDLIQQQEAQRQAEREAEEQRLAEIARQRAYKKIKGQYDDALISLRAASYKLNQIQEFHFLRTADEKQAQIENQLSVIRSWENEVQRLKNLLNNY